MDQKSQEIRESSPFAVPPNDPLSQSPIPKKRNLMPVLLMVLIILFGLSGVGILGYQIVKQNKKNFNVQPLPTPIVKISPTLLATLPVSPAATIPGWKTYTSSKYGFTFDYPPNYAIGTNNDIAVGLIGEDKTKEIFIFVQEPGDSKQQNETFLEFASEWGMSLCAANGPTESSFCDKIMQQIPIQNSFGLTGYKLYFHWVVGSPEKPYKQAKVGPVLAYDVSKQTNNTIRQIQISIAPLNNTTGTIEPSILDQIGSSIRF